MNRDAKSIIEILMLIDDDSDDREFFQEAVENLGKLFECRIAENGLEALEQLRGTDSIPHYIFLDLNMPLMNGFEFLTELKKDMQLKNIPVIIYSTSNFSTHIDRARALGASFFIAKSTNLSHLPADILSAIGATGNKLVN